jgi:hypothetical protein
MEFRHDLLDAQRDPLCYSAVDRQFLNPQHLGSICTRQLGQYCQEILEILPNLAVVETVSIHVYIYGRNPQAAQRGEKRCFTGCIGGRGDLKEALQDLRVRAPGYAVKSKRMQVRKWAESRVSS